MGIAEQLPDGLPGLCRDAIRAGEASGAWSKEGGAGSRSRATEAGTAAEGDRYRLTRVDVPMDCSRHSRLTAFGIRGTFAACPGGDNSAGSEIAEQEAAPGDPRRLLSCYATPDTPQVPIAALGR
jgi:hypothetical protein